MLSYDPKTNTLTARVIDPNTIKPSSETFNQDVLSDIKDSYAKYMTETLREDVNYFVQRVYETFFPRYVDNGPAWSISIGELVTASSYNKKNRINNYYPVYITIKDPFASEVTIELFRLPYMDERGVINVEASLKVLVNFLQAAEGVSYNEQKGTVSIQLSNFSIPISNTKTSVQIGSGNGNTCKLDQAIVALRTFEGSKHAVKEFCEKIHNASLRRISDINPYFDPLTAVNNCTNMRNLVDVNNNGYVFNDKARNALNKALQLDRALGKFLTRDVYSNRPGNSSEKLASVGEEITKPLLKKLKYHMVTAVYVRCVPEFNNLKCVPGTTRPINFLPAGMRCGDLIKHTFSMSSSYLANPKYVSGNNPLECLVNLPGTVGNSSGAWTREQCEFIRDFNEALGSASIANPELAESLKGFGCFQPITVERSNGIQYQYESDCEILTNETFLGSDIGYPGADTWYVKDPTSGSIVPQISCDYEVEINRWKSSIKWKPFNGLTINSRDLMAIYSIMGAYRLNPNEYILDNKDEILMKTVWLANETFSYAFRKATDKIMTTKAPIYRQKKRTATISAFFVPELQFEFQKLWKSTLTSEKRIQDADLMNPASVMAHVCNVTVYTVSPDTVAEDMRLIYLAYFGRICPYETPSGSKIGLVNHKAFGCRIIDGIMYSPYLKIKKEGDKARVSSEFRMMDAQEAAKYKISDRVSLTYTDSSNTYFENTQVLAIIPNEKEGGDRIVVESIAAHELDYVAYLPEQHLSTTANLIPFLGADDPARVSFSLSMQKQAIYCMENERPRVMTSMYKHIFDNMPYYMLKAPSAGRVVGITKSKIKVAYDSDPNTEVTLNCNRVNMNGQCITFMQYDKQVGEHFNKGDIIAHATVAKQGVYAPARNAFVVYLPTGYNYEDAVHLSADCAHHYTSISLHEQTVVADKGTTTDNPSTKYITEGDYIATLSKPLANNGKEAHKVHAQKVSGYYYDSNTKPVNAKSRKQYINYELLGFNRAKAGDKMAGRHGNKGVCSHVSRNSEMPMFANGRIADICLNPCGVPSRMNIGQNLEAHLGFVAEVLNIYICSDPFNGATHEEIQKLMHYVYDLANAENGTDDWFDITINKYKLGHALYDHIMEDPERILDWKGAFHWSGTARMYDPVSQQWYENPIAFGVSYFLKLEQEVEEKISVRDGMLNSTYVRATQQPVRGATKNGGQRNGEMENVTMAAYGLTDYLHESLNGKADNVGERFLIAKASKDYEIDTSGIERECVSNAVDTLRYELEAVGIYVDVSDEDKADIPSIDRYTTSTRKCFDARLLRDTIQSTDEDGNENKPKQGTKDDLLSAFNKTGGSTK